MSNRLKDRAVVLDLKERGLSQVIDFQHGAYYKVGDVISFFSKMLSRNSELEKENKAHIDALKYQARHHVKTINQNKELKNLLHLALCSMNCDFSVKHYEEFGFNQYPTEKQVSTRIENYLNSTTPTVKKDKDARKDA